MSKEATFDFLDTCEHIGNINWDAIQPDARHTWLTEGLREDFETFLPLGSKQAKTEKGEVSGVIFHQFSGGVKTNRDAWAINFNQNALSDNVTLMMDTYNTQLLKWKQQAVRDVDDFVVYDNKKISWSSGLKQKLTSGYIAEFSRGKIRQTLYRPFTKLFLYFDRFIAERVYVFPSISLSLKPKWRTE